MGDTVQDQHLQHNTIPPHINTGTWYLFPGGTFSPTTIYVGLQPLEEAAHRNTFLPALYTVSEATSRRNQDSPFLYITPHECICTGDRTSTQEYCAYIPQHPFPCNYQCKIRRGCAACTFSLITPQGKEQLLKKKKNNEI